jgi:hypothetical protein
MPTTSASLGRRGKRSRQVRVIQFAARTSDVNLAVTQFAFYLVILKHFVS